MEKEQGLREMWGTIKHPNMMHGKERRKRKEQRTSSFFPPLFEEIMPENFPCMMKNVNLHIQDTQQTPSRINTKRSTSDIW